MASADRRLADDQRAWLVDLLAAPGPHPLLAVVDLLERILPAPHPVGAAASPRDERLRLGHASGLGFDPGEVVSVELLGDPPVARVTASLLGLCGGGTPLPLYMAEEADQNDEQGAAIRGLLDVFHHRLLCLLVRGLRDIDLAASLRADGRDAWSQRVLALLGCDEARAGGLPRATLLRLAPALASGVRSPAMLAVALKICLAEQLGAAALRVDPFSGAWMPIDESQWTRLGGGNARLGDSSVLGTEVLHPSGAAQIVVGPLGGEHYKVFTPGGAGHGLVRALTEGFTPEPIHYDLVLEIEDMSYPPGILGLRRLGEDLWLARSDRKGVNTRMVVAV